MEKRKIIFGTYDTAAHGGWTLCEWTLSDAEHKSNLVEIPGRDGELDASAALTDGVPRYKSRTLTARFELSDGSRLEREEVIRTMINWLDGWRVDIYLPDDPLHYITGRVHVARDYNDPAHASVTVTAVCDPWRYAVTETNITLTTTPGEPATGYLANNGRRSVVPLLTITAAEGETVLLSFGGSSWALGAGEYQLPDLVLPQGSHEIKYNSIGECVLNFRYREAVL